MKTCLLGVDIGTSSCKTALFDASGQVLAQGSCDYPVRYPRRGWAEQDPDLWWQAACRAIRETVAAGGIAPAAIAGIGVAGQDSGIGHVRDQAL